MIDSLHPRQREILEYLRDRTREHRYPPTVREIGRAVGLSSSSTVQNHLNILERKGLVRRDPTKSRTVEIVGARDGAEQGGRVYRLPVVGRVAAGTPILAEQNVEEHLAVAPEVAGDEGAFALRVVGDSMVEAAILDGDLVVVRPGTDAPDGTIVVARIEDEVTGDGEVTVKRLYREPGRVRLQPASQHHQPIYSDSVTIEGRVVAVIRVLR